MLEGTVARLLNHLLGKYVVDLDTENLNVGIFSGHVQLTDLKLKVEALYELGLPIEVRAGTVGKIRLQIPWTSLWNQPVIVNIEDVLIVSGPIISTEPFDAEKNKRLVRAFKRHILTQLDSDSHLIGGPESFSQYLLSNILANLQITVNNIHLRYEDETHGPGLCGGICIGSISAEPTNSKWKPGNIEANPKISHYLIQIDSFAAYWNAQTKLKKWNLPSEYYNWRNAMSGSLANFMLENEPFDFVLKPMLVKVKITVEHSKHQLKSMTDLIIQDCNFQLSKAQYESIMATSETFQRILISWNFIGTRPEKRILDDAKAWWKYAYNAVLEQRIKPYKWKSIKNVRAQYKGYVQTYKQIISNPNDTELKLDLQQYEDNLSIVNIVIARKQARLLAQSRSVNEKNFWTMLPSPERIVLCKKIHFNESNVVQTFNLRIGNCSFLLKNDCKMIFLLTLTQTNLHFNPDSAKDTFDMQLKIEGLVLEGSNEEEQLIYLMGSEHLANSPAYFLRVNFEKMPQNSRLSYKCNIAMDSVEFLFNRYFINDLSEFFAGILPSEKLFQDPSRFLKFANKMLLENWDLNLNIKVPFVVIPEHGTFLKSGNILVIDLGRYFVITELSRNEITEDSTQMEIEEETCSKFNVECTEMQVLFCQHCDNWKDERKEKDTDLHLIPKTNFSAAYAISTAHDKTIPKYKFNSSFHSLKINLSERKIGQILKFSTGIENVIVTKPVQVEMFPKDRVVHQESFPLEYLARIEKQVTINDNFGRVKRGRMEKFSKTAEKPTGQRKKPDINEAWARYVDLPGLEDNISPNNNLQVLLRIVVNEFSLIFSRSSDSADRQYLMFRLGVFTLDIAQMTFGPAYQLTVNSILLTDKQHTTSSGQYLDLIHSPFPNTVDVLTVLYRKVSADCPDFWSHFHGVETSLVADFGTINLLLHQEAIHTLIKYSKYLLSKLSSQLTQKFLHNLNLFKHAYEQLHNVKKTAPVPQGAVKFSHSARLADLNVRVCDSDFDIINVQLSGLELDFLFRANERFVFRSYLSNINVEHLSEITLYSRVLSTDEDKVFELKYVRLASDLSQVNGITERDEINTGGGSLKFQLGQIHLTVLYKLVVQIQRFVVNLEAVSYINNFVMFLQKCLTTATETLKANNTQIHLAINICGPVLLFPQKSSSPNVMIFDMGVLNVENFFKHTNNNDFVENILLKWTGITMTRGVMTLIPSLEMQETLVEPANLNFDIKRYTNVKTAQKFWDVDGALDSIQITLGQKDISTLLLIYTDNIGEGRLLDLFPNPILSPVDPLVQDDETVKCLEAFFCEPKQKNVVVKFSIDEITLELFFDSGELLSSPIRDLNHGLCKLKIVEITTNFTMYTDGSLDGKWSADGILVEEMGPDANIYDKGILHSPVDESKNNNCNITINRAPIVDLTIHQNKSGDRSIDIIIGRLSLSLSVPFCEKLALFICECMPKDSTEFGIVNQGYESEIANAIAENPSSLTISLRINKPEFIFLVETTSNRKRYFLTHTEILSDYSRHGNRLNFVMSLSGLYSLFYDVVAASSNEPYVILKQCDLEFSMSESEEKGKKIIASISSIYVQICSKVVHSLDDILNDISEHFKVPDDQLLNITEAKNQDQDELWDAKKLDEFQTFPKNDKAQLEKKTQHEILLVPKFDIVLIFELDQVQVLLLKSTMELTVYDWSSQLNSTCELTIQGNYFNESLQVWEPWIDPVVMDEQEYKPWDVLIKIFQDKSLPILGPLDSRSKHRPSKKAATPATTTEDEESGEDMMYLEPVNPLLQNRNNRRVKTSLSTFLEDTSDSENEDGAMEKLAGAISDLFTGDWNESEDSDYEHSSEGEDDSDNSKANAVPEETPQNLSKTTYALIDAKETLNVSITPTFLKVLNEMFTVYSNKTLSVVPNTETDLQNDIGPRTKIELYEKTDEDQEDLLLCAKTFENQDSPSNSPTKNLYHCQDYLEDNDKDSTAEENCRNERESSYDFATIASLAFHRESTSLLYDKINSHYVKVHVPNHPVVQTHCSKRKWQKLIKLNHYYLAASHHVGKCGRSLTVSSPLQIKNETCFALSVLYQPSILQELNLEPVGDVTNPFETTMRIAVLEAHEQYNVPLYIAYHCKLFIRPAYAEGHYTSNSGIWWRDLATELDIAHNFHCKPRSDSNLEIFSFRVMLTRNLEINNSQVHSVPNYIIHLLPPLILHNFLPYSLEVENVGLKQLMKIEPGEKKSVYSIDLAQHQKLLIRVKYKMSVWTGFLNFTTYLDEKVIVLTSDSKEVVQLAINTKSERETSCNLYFYVPYWIVNKIGLPVQLKASATNTIHNCLTDDLLLFTYKRHGKQTLNARVYESSWSNEFGLECAGTTGLIICRDIERRKKYLFFLNINLSQMCPRLTKIVTLLPSFLVTNTTNKNLRFMEHNEKTDLWIDIAPKQSLVYWPETSSLQMYVKYRDSKIISQLFNIALSNRTVLRMDKGGALTVEVSGGITGSFHIKFQAYKYGDAPVLVKNYCPDLFLKIQQLEQSQVTLLSPYNSLLYTWDDPTKTRQLVWNVYNNKGNGFAIDPSRDGNGEEKIVFQSVAGSAVYSSSEDESESSVKDTLKKNIRKDKITIYWLCFREGPQRVLLFTQEQKIYEHVLRVNLLEHCDFELLLSLAGLGMSIFTRDTEKEHVYASLSDTPAVWEVNVGRRWKTLTLELASWIEDKYKLHYKKCQLRDYVHIDFEKMYMLKPFFAELKRTYNPAIYMHVRKSKNYQHFNLKVNSIQIDNKINNTIVLQPLPGKNPKENLLIDLDVFKYSNKYCQIYRHVKLNVRDFYVNIENDLFLELKGLATRYKKFKNEQNFSYVQDMKFIQDLRLNKTISGETHALIEYLNVNPFEIQVHVSNKIQIGVINHFTLLDYLFPVNMSPYMPMEGVIHKIMQIERFHLSEQFPNTFCTILKQLLTQFLQQYYSHVLGLQVLVNMFAVQPYNTPYDRGLSDWEKTAASTLYSSRCLLSHINMSPVALEQCVIDTFPSQTMENIQRIRRHGSYQRSEAVPKIVTASSKNFHTGVPNALDQLIVKVQNAGIYCNGEMFFRTTGKALVSLMTRHPDDKSDCVEIAKQALRRATILGEPIRIQQRLTRYCNKFLGLKPFSVYESMGQFLLETVANSRFLQDHYWSHSAIDRTGKSILLISLQHIVRINKCRLWGPWEVEWIIDLDDVVSMPKITSNELTFNLRQTENNSTLMQVLGDREMLSWIQEKIEQAIIVSMDEKSWTV